MTEFEDILDDLGQFGPFQLRIFILVSLFEIPAAWMIFLPVFIQLTYEWTCVFDWQTWRNSSVISEQLNYTKNNNNTELIQYCDSSGLYCDGGENVKFLTDRTSIQMDFALCDSTVLSDWITPLQMAGVLFGGCLSGQLADIFGRRLVFYIVYSLLLLANFITAFSPNWQFYVVCRCFVGMFFSGTMVINFVLPMEFVGARWRTLCGCIGFWAVGYMLLAPLAYLIPNWRHLCIACSLINLPLLATWWWVPESPRWLIQRGRIEEANKILIRLAESNHKKQPDIDKLQAIADLEAQQRHERKKYSYWDLFRTWRMSRNTLIVVFTWFVSSAVYYGTSLNVKILEGNFYLNFFLLGLAEIPAILFVLFVNNRLGRKKTVTFLMLVAGISCAILVFLYILNETEKEKTLAFALLGKFGISGAWAAAQVFSAELFPTVVRNIGIGACSIGARTAIILAPVFVDLGKLCSALPFAIFACLAFSCGVLTFFLPETVDCPLPDALPPPHICCWGGGEGKEGAGDHELNEQKVAMVTSHNGVEPAIGCGAEKRV